jgi:hypothetical protein
MAGEWLNQLFNQGMEDENLGCLLIAGQSIGVESGWEPLTGVAIERV